MAFNLKANILIQPPTNANVAQVIARVNAQLGHGIRGNVNVQLNPAQVRQVNQLAAGLKKVNTSATSAGKAAKNFGQQVGLAARRFSAFTLAAGAFIKLAGAFKASLGRAIEFQRELVRISQVTGETLVGLGRLTDTITRLSTTLGVDSNQLLKTSRVLAQTGLTARETEVALSALAKSSLAPTFGDISRTVEVAIASMRQFNLEASDLEGTLGTINAISKSFAVESDDLGVAIRRAGGAFAATGGDLNELLALFTSVRATTRESAESIATGFRTIFTRLQRVRTLNFLGDLGVDLRNAQGEFVGGFEAIGKLSEALNRLNTTDPRFSKIIEELGGFRQVSKVIPLIKQFATAQTALNVGIRGTNSLSQDAETAQQALAIQIEKVQERWEALIRSFADTSSFKLILDITIKLASALVDVAAALKPILPALLLLGGGAAFRGISGIGTGLSQFKSGFLGRNEGGGVPGTGSTDTVPAMLTPGEFVLRKSAVQSIGLGNLYAMNRGKVGGYNRGGVVKGGIQHFVAGGAVAAGGAISGEAIAGLILAAGALSGQFADMSTILGDVTRGLIAAGSQFFVFRSVGQSLANTGKTADALQRSQERLISLTEKQAQATGNLIAAELSLADAEFKAKQPGATPQDQALAKAAKDEVDVKKAAVDKIKQQEQTALSVQNKAQQRIRNFGNIVGAVTGALGGLAAGLASFGNKRLQASGGEEGLSALATGNAIGQATSQAAAGALILPGIGAAIGGVSGAITGIVQSLRAQAEALDNARVDKSIESLSAVLDEFSAGRLSAVGGLDQLTQVIQGQEKALFEVGVEARRSLLAQAKGQSGVINNFLNEIAEATGSSGGGLKEFKEKTEAVLPFFIKLTGIDIESLDKQFEKLIDSAKEKQNKDEEYVRIQRENIQRLRDLGRIDRAIKGVEQAMNGLVNPITQVGSSFSLIDKSGFFDDIGNVSDVNVLEQVAGQVGNSFGQAGQRLSERVVDVAKTFQLLPEALLNIQQQGGIASGGTFAKRLDETLKGAGIGESIRDTIRTRLRNIAGDSNKEEEIFNRITEDLPGVVGELLGGFEGVAESLKLQFNLIKNESDRLAGLYQQRFQLEQSLIDSLDRTITTRLANEERIADITSTRLAPGRRQQLDTERFSNITQGLNIGGNEVDSLARIISTAKDNIRNFDKQINDADVGDISNLQDLRTAEQDHLARANRALEFLADGANRAAPALRELEDVQKDRKALFDIAKEFTFGDTSSRRDLGKNIIAAIGVSRGGTESIPSSLRGGALSFLERIGDTKLDVLGGRSGTDVINDSIRKQFQGQLSDKDIDALINGGDREQELIAQIAEAGKKAIEATEALSNGIREDIGSLNTFLKESFDFFLKNLAFTLADANARSLEAEVRALEAQKTNTDKATDAIERLNNFGLNTEKDINRALFATQKLQEQGRGLGDLTNLNNVSDFARSGDLFKAILEEGGKFGAGLGTTISTDATRQIFDRIQRLLVERGLTEDQAIKVRGAAEDNLPELKDAAGFFRDRKLADIAKAFTGFDPFRDGVTPTDIRGPVDTLLKEFITTTRDRQSGLTEAINKLGLSTEETKLFNTSAKAIQKAITDLREAGQNQKLDDLKQSIDSLNDTLNGVRRKAEEARRIVPDKPKTKAASGGLIGGIGNRDTVPALLTPGEFVIRKSIVQKLGSGFLGRLNKTGKLEGFQSGGLVREELIRKEELRRLKRQEAAVKKAAEIRRKLSKARQEGEKTVRRDAADFLDERSRRNQAGVFIARRQAEAFRQRREERASNIGQNLRFQVEDARDFRGRFGKVVQEKQFDTLRQGRDDFQRRTGIVSLNEQGRERRAAIKRQVQEERTALRIKIENERAAARLNATGAARFAIDRRNARGGSLPGAGQGFFNPGQDVVPTSFEKASSEGFNLSSQDFSKFATSVQEFGKFVSLIPQTITMNGTHNVNVVFNGAEVLSQLQPSFEKFVLVQIENNMNKFISNQLKNKVKPFKAEATTFPTATGPLATSSTSVIANSN